MNRTRAKVLVVTLLVAFFPCVVGSLHPGSELAFAKACLCGGVLVVVSLLLFRLTDRALEEREALLCAFIGALPDTASSSTRRGATWR